MTELQELVKIRKLLKALLRAFRKSNYARLNEDPEANQ